MKRFGYFMLIAVSAIIIGCTNQLCLDEVLDFAGSNRSELEAVLNQYRSVTPNPDKLRAAEFLIENMQFITHTLAMKSISITNMQHKYLPIRNLHRSSSVTACINYSIYI